MRTDTLPPEFDLLAGKVNYVHRKTENEFSGSCPECGGVPHENGEFPDRFLMWRVSNYGKPLGWCRGCGYTWTPDKERKPSREEIEQWRRVQIQKEEENKAKAERALELLNNEKIWEKFNQSNNAYSIGILEKRGFSKSWIQYLQFGLNQDYTVRSLVGEEWVDYHSPAITIPIWFFDSVVQNVKLRVTNPRSSRDRYRNWYETGDSYLYVPTHDMALENCGVILCEGEFKGALMSQKMDSMGEILNLRPVAFQSKKPNPELFKNIIQCDPIYVWIDPDGAIPTGKEKKSAVQYFVDNIKDLEPKKGVRVVDCPVKSDDGILQGMNPMNFIRMARKV